jgi:integrase/recombinase XerD
VGTPLITIFVRHTPGCKYEGDEFSKRCACRKHFRWTQDGKQYRQKAGTRAWGEAEEVKRRLEDQLAGRAVVEPTKTVTLAAALASFIKDKNTQGLDPGTVSRYKLETERLVTFCESQGVYTPIGITRPLLTDYADTWAKIYPSTYTRAFVRKRMRIFLRYCHDAGWLPQVPKTAPIKITEPRTEPLTDEEFTKLLEAVPVEFPNGRGKILRAIILLMRWSGLAVFDAALFHEKELKFYEGAYHVVTSRQKNDNPVYVPIPLGVATEIIACKQTANKGYFFRETMTATDKSVAHDRSIQIGKVFRRAKIRTDGHMLSHRLRDTFAVDLLQKGVPIEDVSKMLGHASVQTTEKSYARWVKGRQDRLTKLVTGSWTEPEAASA